MPDDTLHARILPWKGKGKSELTEAELDASGYYPNATAKALLGSPRTAAACSGDAPASSALDAARGFMDFTRTTVDPQCWPLTLAVDLLIPSNYLSTAVRGNCEQGRRTLSLVQFLTSTTMVGPVFMYFGIARVSDAHEWASYINATLNKVTCDGTASPVARPADRLGSGR
jgi:hypothetical protein